MAESEAQVQAEHRRRRQFQPTMLYCPVKENSERKAAVSPRSNGSSPRNGRLGGLSSSGCSYPQTVVEHLRRAARISPEYRRSEQAFGSCRLRPKRFCAVKVDPGVRGRLARSADEESSPRVQPEYRFCGETGVAAHHITDPAGKRAVELRLVARGTDKPKTANTDPIGKEYRPCGESGYCDRVRQASRDTFRALTWRPSMRFPRELGPVWQVSTITDPMGKEYRSRGERIPTRRGDFYRSRRENLPTPVGYFTERVGADYRSSGETLRTKHLQICSLSPFQRFTWCLFVFSVLSC